MVLEVGVLSGVPMRPEQIKELMQLMTTPKVAHTSPDERHAGEDPPDDAPESSTAFGE